MKKQIQEYIFSAVMSGKKVTARRIGEDCREPITLAELSRALEYAPEFSGDWKLKNFLNGKFPTFQFREDADYIISVTVR